jgi:dolichol kinase
MIVICALYPLRLVRFARRRNPGNTSGDDWRFRIPSTIEPAPLLYPTLLPVFVALSLLPSDQSYLLPNLILGLSSLPPQLIPFPTSYDGLNVAHWFISILPLIASEYTALPFPNFPAKPYLLKTPPPQGISPEMLISLFPLHQALLPPLQYLTTTSLLSAESQLLSTSLINLLLCSTSPQATVLQALLWGGGVALFILCGHVLRWGVALARIPRWRFRRVGQVIKARNKFLDVLEGGLRSGRRSSFSLFGRKFGADNDSDADEDGPPGFDRSKSPGLKLRVHDLINRNDGDLQARSAVEGSSTFTFLNNKDTATSPAETYNVRRRHTLPTNTYSLDSATPSSPKAKTKQKRWRSSGVQSYLSLTSSQATARKWIYALYVYVVILVVILFGIREYIGRWAMPAQFEPIGWAIGYMFADLPGLRSTVADWELQNWICLPDIRTQSDGDYWRLLQITSEPLSSPSGVAERYRHEVFGQSNTRLLISAYWLCVIAVGMAVVLFLRSIVEVDTRRKVFHGMVVAMFLPTTFIDPAYVALCLSLILAIFILLDLFRASQLPPLSKYIAQFLTPYVDGRDLRGPVVVSHIFLLIGCAIPLWLSMAGIARCGEGCSFGWDVDRRELGMVSGVVCVGMGDAAASLIGRRFGRRKWMWPGGKSLEGSAAFTLAVAVGLIASRAWLQLGGWQGQSGDGWPYMIVKALLAGAGGSLVEAVLTGGNDNVIVPVVMWLLVKGLNI